MRKILLLSISGLFCVAIVGIVALKQPLLAAANPITTPLVELEALRLNVNELTINQADRHFDKPAVLNATAQYLELQFFDSLARTQLQTYTVNGNEYSNVIAKYGPEQGAPIIIGAHYDAHENTMGADDNASGVAGLLALARLFKDNPPKIPVELVAYTLEEPPNFRTENMGSRQHAQSLVDAGIKPRLIMVLEMIGYFDDAAGSQQYPVSAMKLLYPSTGNFISVVGNFANMNAVRSTKAAMQASSDLPVQSINSPAWVQGIDFSDHASYWLHNMPAVMISDTAFFRNKHYHQSTDTADTLDYVRMAKVIQGVYGVVKSLEKENT